VALDLLSLAAMARVFGGKTSAVIGVYMERLAWARG
jgi:hypothetical protein